MLATKLRSQIKTGAYNKTFESLYGASEAAKKRYSQLCGSFIDFFGNCDVRLFSAPGRTEIGGNHTDHQRGVVIAAAVDTDIIACVTLNNNDEIRLKSFGYAQDVIKLDDLDIKSDEYGKSKGIIRGICRAFKDNGYNIGGFDAYTTSTVPKGSGLSSSAAFEVLIATILNVCYNDSKVSLRQIAAFSQYAECTFFGKPCGLLDQTACAYGGVIYVDFKEPSNPICEKIEVDINSQEYTLYAVNTGGNHSGLTADYSAITTDCASVSKALSKNYIGELQPSDILENIALLKERCTDRAIIRSLHVAYENERVPVQKKLLKNGDFQGFLRCVRESGDSSANLLQNLYSTDHPTEQGIPLGLALAKSVISENGAARVHGGGFAGTIQVYVPNQKEDDFLSLMYSAFGKESCTRLNIRRIGGCEIKE